MEKFEWADGLLGDGESIRLSQEDSGEDGFRPRQHMLQVSLNARSTQLKNRLLARPDGGEEPGGRSRRLRPFQMRFAR